MDRWRLEKIDGDDDSAGWNVLKLDDDGDTAASVLQAWDEDDARHVIAALRWYDSFQCGQVAIPKSKRAPVRVKMVVKEVEP